jgi:hypothetical protein
MLLKVFFKLAAFLSAFHSMTTRDAQLSMANKDAYRCSRCFARAKLSAVMIRLAHGFTLMT